MERSKISFLSGKKTLASIKHISMKIVGFNLFSNKIMKTVTIRAEEFNSEWISIKKHEKLVIDIENLLIYGIWSHSISYYDINHKTWEWLNHVRIDLENNNYLKAYLQYINNNKIMSIELYDLLTE